ncbi:hypothetical protein NMY22_g14721 [Coprinellus aureogranulatus]|nr:hypothetical protein NMY22_g14721 [Coprinellus aureogranulatus]
MGARSISIRLGALRQATPYPKATKESKYAEKRGVLRGGSDKAKDATADGADVPLNLNHKAVEEGLYRFVQTGSRCRLVLTAVYKSKPPALNVPCCDNCCPEFLDRSRPRKPEAEKRTVGVKRGIPNLEVMVSLNYWRLKISKRDFGPAFFSADGFLSDDLVEDLASVGHIADLNERLKLVLGGKWSWIDEYGGQLSTELASLDIPSHDTQAESKTTPALPCWSSWRGGKSGEWQGEGQGKRQRLASTGSIDFHHRPYSNMMGAVIGCAATAQSAHPTMVGPPIPNGNSYLNPMVLGMGIAAPLCNIHLRVIHNTFLLLDTQLPTVPGLDTGFLPTLVYLPLCLAPSRVIS